MVVVYGVWECYCSFFVIVCVIVFSVLLCLSVVCGWVVLCCVLSVCGVKFGDVENFMIVSVVFGLMRIVCLKCFVVVNELLLLFI